jgi:hypothetical protein
LRESRREQERRDRKCEPAGHGDPPNFCRYRRL